MEDNRATSDQTKAFLSMTGACVAFSTMSAIVKAASAAQLSPFEVAFFRTFVSLLLLLPLMRQRGLSYFGHNRRLLLARGVIGCLSMYLGFFALGRAPMGEVTVLWKTSTLFTALFAPFVLGERFSWALLLFICLGLIGSVLVLDVGISGQALAPGVGIALLAALGAGFSVSLVAMSIRQLQATEHSLTIVFSFCFYAAILSLLFSLPFFVIPQPRELFLLVLMGVVGLVGQILYTNAFRYAPAADVQSFTFAEVLFAVVIGMFFWGEVPHLLSLAGGLCIIASSVLILRLRAR